MDLAEALAYLDQHVNAEATAGRIEHLSLDRMRRLVHVLGDPQTAYPLIHITGTNGKGSTARLVTALLRASGLYVGTYNSPHLERINERISLDGEPIDDARLAALVGYVASVEPLSGVRPSYFEILTAAAYHCFADEAVDVAVAEVGLLGRFDATNVADGTVAVLTNVGRDHTDFEGDWREAIAEEKSGIVKPGSTFVLGETDPALRSIFEAAGAEELWLRDRDFGCERNELAIGGRMLDIRTPGGRLEDVFVPLHGAHQGDNAACAIAAVEAFFGRPLPDDVVAEGFASVRAPGRFEVVSHQPLVILDGAHNPDGAHAAATTLAEGFTTSGRRIFVIGMLQGRDPAEMLKALTVAPGDLVVATTAPSPRAIDAIDLAGAAAGIGAEATAHDDVADGIRTALDRAQPDDVVLISGSLYSVGAARGALRALGLVE